MKKLAGVGLLLVGLYFSSVFIRAELSERHAEKEMEKILVGISNPWHPEKIRLYGSDWLNNKARLTPEELSRLAAQDLGALIRIERGPVCVFQSGHEVSNMDREVVWAVCEVTARFKKEVAMLKIRLVDESLERTGLFDLLGKSLKLNDISSIEIIDKGGRK